MNSHARSVSTKMIPAAWNQMTFSDASARWIEVLSKVEPRFGSVIMAYAWYRSEALSGFSGQTAMELVRCDRVQDVADLY